MKRVALALMVPVAMLAAVAACAPPLKNPATYPEPGDNQVKLEVEAVRITSNAVTTVAENIYVEVNAVNGNGEPLVGDNFEPLHNWESGPTSTIPGKPWTMIFSQAPGEGAGSIILGVKVFPQSNTRAKAAVSIKCHWFVKRSGETQWTEDKPKIQVGSGATVTCIYSIQFPTGK